MSFCAGVNSMNTVMEHSFWLCIIFLLNFASIRAETLNMSSEAGSLFCPLKISTDIDAHPWMLDQCSGPDKSHCCERINDLIKILHFSWMHTTGSFLLPTNHTAAVFKRIWEATGSLDQDRSPAIQQLQCEVWKLGLGFEHLSRYWQSKHLPEQGGFV